MKIIYVAGPYRGNTPWEISRNIERAREASAHLWSAGFAVFCPHANSMFLDGVVDDKKFLEGGLEILKLCDALFVQGEYSMSEGTQIEIKLAKELNIPVFFSYEHARAWLLGEEEKENT